MTDFDTRVPHIARIYDYWLGGKDNFAADRQAAEAAVAASPGIKPGVRANRRFLGRAVRYMADAGVRQFLDVGTGIPTAENTHQVAQSIVRDARIVYVDNDPIVLSHARALLTSAPEGVTDYIDADARDTQAILAAAEQTLDLSRPVGVMLIAILHCIPDEDDPYQLVRSLLDGVPRGSFLALTHPARKQQAVPGRGEEVLNRSYDQNVTLRTREQVSRFFDGLQLVEPGVVPVTEWHPESTLDLNSPWLPIVGGVARKPLCPGAVGRSGAGCSPGVYDLDADVVEVRQVPGRQGGAARPADGCDERAEPSDRLPGTLAGTRDDRVMLRGCHAQAVPGLSHRASRTCPGAP